MILDYQDEDQKANQDDKEWNRRHLLLLCNRFHTVYGGMDDLSIGKSSKKDQDRIVQDDQTPQIVFVLVKNLPR